VILLSIALIVAQLDRIVINLVGLGIRPALDGLFADRVFTRPLDALPAGECRRRRRPADGKGYAAGSAALSEAQFRLTADGDC
jgi:hypothetical protein